MDRKSLNIVSKRIKWMFIVLALALTFIISTQSVFAAEWMSGNYRWQNGTQLRTYRNFLTGDYYDWVGPSITDWNLALGKCGPSNNVRFVLSSVRYSNKSVSLYQGNHGDCGWVGLMTPVGGWTVSGMYIIDANCEIELNTYTGPGYNWNTSRRRETVAHEMGHTLYLGDVSTGSKKRLMWHQVGTGLTAPAQLDFDALQMRYY